jgi:hypothetical protein
VSFLANLFTIRKILVFMNNLYHKVAVASLCTALSFALEANKEAEAATFTLEPQEMFLIRDTNGDGLGDEVIDDSFPLFGRSVLAVGREPFSRQEYRAFYEFNIASLSLASNTVISSAIFQGRIESIEAYAHALFSSLNIHSYVGNGSGDLSDFTINQFYVGSIPGQSWSPGSNFNFDITTSVNYIVSNRESFAGVAFDAGKSYLYLTEYATSLTITTVDVAEPVPEPATILGSALALGVGGWLKQKKLSQQSKTTSQH